MNNEKDLKKDVTETTDAKLIDKNIQENPKPDTGAEEPKKKKENFTLAQLDNIQRGAVGATKADSTKTVEGSSDIADTGTIINYE